ncbi:MBL fold metallo-hydrolase [Flavobacterium sp.]|uniref:ComEC/Rec2 family competence protein n=1 Tax=Flavobacterium sp. TaxID=239 RepID=UPI0024883DBA|nr:MBL fold metallo-hydrolase [Flavobacterium sp.]MDI1316262.1 MBL fold metallo-hydrolase [Flavobacterium sp.]
MSGNVEMVFWDVQHGHATYIKSPNNRHIVVDLGIGSYDDNNESFSPLLHLKNVYKIQQLDYVIITHPHLDHIDDILNFDALSPKVLMRPKQITNSEVMQEEKDVITIRNSDKPKFEKYCEINNRYSEPVLTESVNNVRNPTNFGGLKITAFNPVTCDHKNFNNHSIISVFEYASIKVVVPGDNEKCSFEELLQDDKFKEAIKNADILLAPHHGRESGYFAEFIDLVNPRITIVSDGRFCETSANGRYSQKSRGWNVTNGKGNKELRKCLTTNSDGEVFVKFGFTNDNKNQSFLNVKTKV